MQIGILLKNGSPYLSFSDISLMAWYQSHFAPDTTTLVFDQSDLLLDKFQAGLNLYEIVIDAETDGLLVSRISDRQPDAGKIERRLEGGRWAFAGVLWAKSAQEAQDQVERARYDALKDWAARSKFKDENDNPEP